MSIKRFLHKAVFLPVLSVLSLLPVSGQITAQAADIPAAAPAASSSPAAPKPNAPPSFADMVTPLLPAVVNISSTQKAGAPQEDDMQAPPGGPQDQGPQDSPFPPGSPFEDFFNQFMERHGGENGAPLPAVPAASLGSGFVIDAEKGLIVTNNHVVKDAEEVRVTFHDDETLPAEVLGRDDKIDLALLKVTTKKKLTAVKFGDSDVLRVGDWVVAIGNPFGLGGTVTAGIVSARQRDINSGPYDDFIQTDASINRGNSGGPMFNLKGEVIGINTAIFSPSGGSVGIGFAIPSALAKPVIAQIMEFGHTRRGWLGVRIQNVTEEIAESLSLPDTHGALIAAITAKGPAETAKLQPGDVITEFGGQKLNAMRNLPRLVAETPIGSEAGVTYWRNGKPLKTTVKVGELEKAEETGLLSESETPPPAQGLRLDTLGMTLQQLSPPVRQNYGIASAIEGVIVTKVDDMSEAAEKGLLEGDVIMEVDQQPVSDPGKIKDMMEAAQKQGRNSVLFLVTRAGDVRFVAVKITASKHAAPKKPDADKKGPENKKE